MLSTKAANVCKELVPESYLNLAQQAHNSRNAVIKELLEKRKLPLDGWPDTLIEDLVRELSSMDSNNFPNNIGFGEREGRIYSALVARRHYNFGHGVGRSGNLIEAQPKAAGSTIMSNLTNSLLLDLFHAISLKLCESTILVPMATGMTLMLCMLTLKKERPNAKYVLWSRIDQKSCFKCITTAGLVPVIIEQKDTLSPNLGYITDVKTFEEKIYELGAENIVCIFSTTSCFAPRNPDEIVELAKLAQKYNVPHLINNAYGLQDLGIPLRLEYAQRVGRVDLYVQSTDKNLMVPVGGAIVASQCKELVQRVAQMYAGRASSTQTLDVLMTLLSMGKNGYLALLKKQHQNFTELQKSLVIFASSNATTLLPSGYNQISIALSLAHLSDQNEKLTKFGAMLYSRGVSGARCVVSGQQKIIDGYTFENWGAHNSSFSGAYVTFAAAIGMRSEELPKLMRKLKECSDAFKKASNKENNSQEIEHEIKVEM